MNMRVSLTCGALAAALTACSSSTTVVVISPDAASVTYAPTSTQEPVSPTDTSVPTIEGEAAAFAADVQAAAGRDVTYAVLQSSDFSGKTSQSYAPMVDINFPNAPKSFSGWEPVHTALIDEGDLYDLQSVGATSHALDSGFTLLLVVPLDDAEKVPGPNAHDVVKVALLKEKAHLTPA